MLSLIRIRIKYLIRNPCLLFWTYLFIPGIILFVILKGGITKYSKETIMMQSKNSPIKSGEDYFFNEINSKNNNNMVKRSYNSIKNFLYKTSILVNDENDCSTIQNFIQEETDIKVNCSFYENNFTNQTTHIIKFEKNKKNNNYYNIYLKERQIDDKTPLLFSNPDLDQDKINDLFYVNKETYNGNKFEDEKFRRFWELQSFLAKLLIYLKNEKINVVDFKMYLGFNPYPNHYRFTDENDYYIYSFLSFIISLQFSLIGYNFNIRMIDEKENKLNVLLERQGISKLKYNISWLITFFALFLFSIIVFTMFLFNYIIFHFFLIIINMLFFSFCIYSVCIFFSLIIKTTKEGTTSVKFFNFGSILLGFVIVLPKTSKFTKIIFAFIPQINLYLCICAIFNLNNFENLTWDRLWLKAAKMSFMETIIMYIIDICFYLGLSFFIQSFRDSGLDFYSYIKSYFTKVSRNVNGISSLSIEKDNISKNNFETYHQELSEVNKYKQKNNQSLKIINVSKNFDDLKAVDNFNGELFPNEIFCLLGHNGTGKSTLINMISGIFNPDQGDILLNGKSLVTNKDYLYENIGLCQQEDIFFDYLTVEEHLEYMCRIKGSIINNKEIEELINKIELGPKKSALCSTLSGGQKRKLCIALALIGDSKIILLDEPTSGMDVMARRSLWEFLKNYKKDKIILLTTHFLDEAEYLGDRIGIMSDGHFICSGTSSFLKSKYPCGFNINLLINSSVFNEEYKKQFYNSILQYEPNVEIKVASKGIFSINIQSTNQHISELFDYIEQNKSKFGIEDYTVSSTSLEDVFLKINNKTCLNDYLKKDENKIDIMGNFGIVTTSDFFSQLHAQIMRSLFPLYRNKILFFLELLSGLGFVYIFIFFFSDFIINATNTKLNLIEVLESNHIYIYEKNIKKNYLKNSYIYQKGSINLKKIKEEPKNIIDFMNLVYNQSYANIAKGALYINGTNPDLYEVYNTEVDTSLNGYFYANIILFVSAFLKNNYNIDAAIIPEISVNIISGNQENIDFLSFFKDFIVLIIVCLISLFGFVIFLGGLMLEKIKEKRTNIKHLLYLSGSNLFTYWLGFFIVDYIKLLFFNILLIFPIYFVNGVATYFCLDLLLISLSSLSFIYFISFFCSKDDEGSKILFLVVFGFILIISFLCVTFKNSLLKYTSSFTEIYKLSFFDLTPVTSMALSFLRIIISYSLFHTIDEVSSSLGNAFGTGFNLNNIMGFQRPKIYLYTSFIAQGVNLIIYSLLLIFAESGILGKIIHRIQLKIFESKNNYVFSQELVPDEFSMNNNNLNSPLIQREFKMEKESSILVPDNYNDDNNIKNKMSFPSINNCYLSDPLNNPYVKKEIEKVNSDKLLTTRIVNLRKTFYSCCGRRNIRAINNLYLGLEPNEKFGLLGFNGSGKTTIFRAITNEILTDAGSITLFGYDSNRQFKYIRTIIGYCPQINPLFDFMKVKEIIQFYSNLKTCNQSVESICKQFGLSKYLNTYTINLSGGNKRKLTFAIAMMNMPRLLLLDEPSTGVDPESRRTMWKNINQLSNSGHKYNMILTTHSMEEAEVLCDTVSWLKAGNFIALGNPEELKIKYSAGYKLHIKFDESFMKIGNKIYNKEEINKLFNDIGSMIEGLDRYKNYIFSNINIEPYLKSIIKIIEKIKNKTNRIYLEEIRKDVSFELFISIIKEKQKDLFCEILNLKNKDKTIAEINISMQSLENILTSLN